MQKTARGDFCDKQKMSAVTAKVTADIQNSLIAQGLSSLRFGF